MSRTGSEIRQSEAQSKMIQDRITAIEKHLGTLCDTMSSYTRKTARLRDKGDLLAKEIVGYAEYEKLNPTLKQGLTTFAEHLSAVQDYRQAEVQRLEAKAVTPLSNYGLLCKQTKNELKSTFSAHDKEMAQKKKLEKIQQKHPSDQQQIRQAQSELQKASVEATRSERALEQQMETFECKKLEDVKKILSDFVKIEMIFHAKALEMYTQCYQSLSVIDPECDLEELLRQIRPNGSTKRMSIASTLTNGSNETPRSTPPTFPRGFPVSPNTQTTPPKKSHNPTQQTTPKQFNNSNQSKTPKQQQTVKQQPSTPPKKTETSVKSQNSTPAKMNSSTKQDSSPARRIIPVGTLKDESDEEDESDYDDDEDDSDEDVSDWDDETTEASTARTPNGKMKK